MKIAAACATVCLALAARAAPTGTIAPERGLWGSELAASLDALAKSPDEAAAEEAAKMLEEISVPRRLAWARRLAAAAPSSRSLRMALAGALLRDGETAEGRKIAAQVVAEQAEDPVFLRDAAVQCETWREWDLAEDVERRLLAKIPQDAWARLHLARAYQLSGDRRRALDEYLWIVDRGLNPDSRFYAEAYRAARALGAGERLQAKDAAWKEQIRAGASNVKPYVLLAQAALSRKDGASLAEVCGAASARFPADETCADLLASFYNDKGDWPDLIALRRRALDKTRPRWDDFIRLAEAYAAAGRWPEAEKALRGAKAPFPERSVEIDRKTALMEKISAAQPSPPKAAARSAEPFGKDAARLESLLEDREDNRFSDAYEAAADDPALLQKLKAAGYLGP